jgi:glycosyltransferase involved in cell wall biosynthesis
MKLRVPITVCIPCYKYHIPQLKRCLDSIEQQTMLPKEVIVSCSSSTDTDIQFSTEYSFSVQIITTIERKNAAENRNIAANIAQKDSKFISFFDADDVMHPQRLEAISTAIQQFPNTNIILHNYYTPVESKSLVSWPIYQSFSFHINSLARAPSGCAVFTPNWRERIHHSQVSVSKHIWELVKFNETKEYERKEDAVFCGDCLALSNIQSVYVQQPLSKYFEEGTTHTV